MICLYEMMSNISFLSLALHAALWEVVATDVTLIIVWPKESSVGCAVLLGKKLIISTFTIAEFSVSFKMHAQNAM